MEAARGFQKPKVYDPSLAQMPQPQPRILASQTQPSKKQEIQAMQDLGFEDSNEHEERIRELTEQLEEARNQAAELKSALATSREAEGRSQKKLESFQQVNRSQSALMKSELQKSRRRLAHTQAVAHRLRLRSEWLQERSPKVELPAELDSLPTEEEAVEEEGDLVKLHQRWENDVAQLEAELRAGWQGGGGGGGSVGSGAGASMEVEAMRRRVAELENEVRQCKVNAERQAAATAAAPALPPAAPAAVATDGNQIVENLQKELEASQKEVKDNMKKLKQLAAAYKQVEQSKKETEEKLRQAQEAAKQPQAPVRKPLSAALVQSVQAKLGEERRQIQELRNAVMRDLKVGLPAALEEVMRGKMQQLAELSEGACKEWKEKYNNECDKRRKLHNLVQELRGNIRVYCRCRPLNERESGSCLSFPSPGEIQIYNEATASRKTWQFNEVFEPKSTQADLFASVRDLVVSLVDGYNVCIFAYGQTGSGKTHSMQGIPSDRGIYWRTFNELFKVAAERKSWTVTFQGALVEIYNEEIRDLLLDPNEKNRPKLQVRQDKGKNFVPGLTMKALSNSEEVEEMLNTGQQNRTVACTDMNQHSSRSHLLVQIFGTMVTPQGKELNSVITLVDLAGSERLAKSGVSGDRAKEAIAINKSLSALGDVINSRASKSAHTPFRNSTLTHLLQDSLSGDSKTLMLLQVNPCSEHVEETTCSLQFGARVNAVEMKK